MTEFSFFVLHRHQRHRLGGGGGRTQLARVGVAPPLLGVAPPLFAPPPPRFGTGRLGVGGLQFTEPYPHGYLAVAANTSNPSSDAPSSRGGSDCGEVGVAAARHGAAEVQFPF